MKKNERFTQSILLLFIWSIFTQVVSAQTCLTDGIQFTTQGQVDSFSINYPNCDSIEGALRVGLNTEIVNLDGLQNVKAVGGLYLWVNPFLTSIEGLSNVESISGDLYIWTNTSLTSLHGLEKVKKVDGLLRIWSNVLLPTLEGLENIETIGGDLDVSMNDSLSTLDGLQKLKTIGGDLNITSSSGLTSLGLKNLNTIGGRLILKGNGLTTISSLGKLTAIGSAMQIENNPSLVSLSGLENIQQINADMLIKFNSSLTSLQGLENVTSIYGALQLLNNTSLTSIVSLENISPSSIDANDNGVDLTIAYNSSLSICNIESVCGVLLDTTKTAYIAFNADGCESIDVIDCSDIYVDIQHINPKQLVVSPNPASSFIDISTDNLMTSVQVFNQMGQVMQLPVTQLNSKSFQVDIRALPAGFYVVAAKTSEGMTIGKLVVN